jgi:hypothetical protein
MVTQIGNEAGQNRAKEEIVGLGVNEFFEFEFEFIYIP